MQQGLEHLLRLSAAAAAVTPTNSSSSLIVDFLIGSTAAWQTRFVRAYTASQLSGSGRAGQRTLMLLSLCYWEYSVWPRQVLGLLGCAFTEQCGPFY